MSSISRLGRFTRGATYLAALAVLITVRTPADAADATPLHPGNPELHRLPPEPRDAGSQGTVIRVLLGSVILLGLVMDTRGRPTWR